MSVQSQWELSLAAVLDYQVLCAYGQPTLREMCVVAWCCEHWLMAIRV
jgi:hypothetical protein